jgi:hypothetical protein
VREAVKKVRVRKTGGDECLTAACNRCKDVLYIIKQARFVTNGLQEFVKYFLCCKYHSFSARVKTGWPKYVASIEGTTKVCCG